jgi:DNA-binding response OmpR family regulator
MAIYNTLLVDDEPDFVSTLAERLRLRDLDVAVATDGYEALEYIDQNEPPVVVLDVIMPGMNGLDTLTEIKRRHPKIQVILLTGRGLTKDGIEGMRRGAYDYIMKPVKIEELLAKMNLAYKAALEAEK